MSEGWTRRGGLGTMDVTMTRGEVEVAVSVGPEEDTVVFEVTTDEPVETLRLAGGLTQLWAGVGRGTWFRDSGVTALFESGEGMRYSTIAYLRAEPERIREIWDQVRVWAVTAE